MHRRRRDDMAEDEVSADLDRRVAAIAGDADLAEIADALSAGRTQILSRWLEVAARQPFHRERPDGAVTDHIPTLFDAVVALLGRSGSAQSGEDDKPAPLDDPAIIAAATSHAQMRFEQGLGPVAVVTEFRLLRHEIGRSLSSMLDSDARPADIVGGLAVVGDALDGAATVGLTTLSDRIETLREAFLATTLHDIRQPITLVEGSLHLADRWLGAPDPDQDRLREAIGDALTASGELVEMIDTLSDASRVAMGALDPDLEPASLEGIVRGSIEAMGASARTRVELAIAEGPHLIGLWDTHLLHRVVANVVGNALKYSGPSGVVRVAVGREGTDVARLTVVDEGLGMNDEELATVFDRFVRADRARRENIPGLGLGLYACRGIVTAHGGTIEVHSRGHDQGTTVEVRLPLLDGDGDD
jgi:signal transduction histidine kinase